MHLKFQQYLRNTVYTHTCTHQVLLFVGVLECLIRNYWYKGGLPWVAAYSNGFSEGYYTAGDIPHVNHVALYSYSMFLIIVRGIPSLHQTRTAAILAWTLNVTMTWLFDTSDLSGKPVRLHALATLLKSSCSYHNITTTLI